MGRDSARRTKRMAWAPELRPRERRGTKASSQQVRTGSREQAALLEASINRDTLAKATQRSTRCARSAPVTCSALSPIHDEAQVSRERAPGSPGVADRTAHSGDPCNQARP